MIEDKQPQEIKNCPTKWRDRHQNSVAVVRENFFASPMLDNIATGSVISGCCITLLTGIHEPEQNGLAEVVTWSGVTFLSTLAFSYLFFLCKGPQVPENQEVKSRER